MWVIEIWTEVHTPVQLVVVMHLKFANHHIKYKEEQEDEEESLLETN